MTCRHWSGRRTRLREVGDRAAHRLAETSRCIEGPSGFFLLAGALGDEQRRAAGRDAFGRNSHLAHIIAAPQLEHDLDRKSTRLNSSHLLISYAVFFFEKKKKKT